MWKQNYQNSICTCSKKIVIIVGENPDTKHENEHLRTERHGYGASSPNKDNMGDEFTETVDVFAVKMNISLDNFAGCS